MSFELGIMSCVMYDGPDYLQIHLTYLAPGNAIKSTTFDFGDGTTQDGGPTVWPCGTPNMPFPLYNSSHAHQYAALGSYQVKATVVFTHCDGSGDQSLTTEITAYRVAGARPRQG